MSSNGTASTNTVGEEQHAIDVDEENEEPAYILFGGPPRGTPSLFGLSCSYHPEASPVDEKDMPSAEELDFCSEAEEVVPIKDDDSNIAQWGVQVMRMLHKRNLWWLIVENKICVELAVKMGEDLGGFWCTTKSCHGGLRDFWTKCVFRDVAVEDARLAAFESWYMISFHGDYSKYVDELDLAAQQLAFLGHEVFYVEFTDRLRKPFERRTRINRKQLEGLTDFIKEYSSIRGLVDHLQNHSIFSPDMPPDPAPSTDTLPEHLHGYYTSSYPRIYPPTSY